MNTIADNCSDAKRRTERALDREDLEERSNLIGLPLNNLPQNELDRPDSGLQRVGSSEHHSAGRLFLGIPAFLWPPARRIRNQKNGIYEHALGFEHRSLILRVPQVTKISKVGGVLEWSRRGSIGTPGIVLTKSVEKFITLLNWLLQNGFHSCGQLERLHWKPFGQLMRPNQIGGSIYKKAISKC